MPNTPNMDLAQSTPLVTGGPLWAQRIEDNLVLIDQHDHSTGKGVPITPAGLNINANLNMGEFAIDNLLSSNYVSQAAPLTGASRVYVSGGDLYYNNGSGTAVQVTSGSAVNVSGVGGITGLAGTDGAVTYSDITKTFVFTQDANNPASLIAGTVSIGEPGVVSPSFINLKSPTSLAGAYDITLFAALPASKKYVQIDGAGALTATDALDGVTLESNAGTMRIKDLGVTLAKLAADSVDENKIVSTTISATGALDGGSGTKLAVRRDGTYVGVSGNNLTIPAAAVDNTRLATSRRAQGTGGTGSRTGAAGSNDLETTYTVLNANRSIRLSLASDGGANTVAIGDNGSGGGYQRTGVIEFFADGVQVGGAVIISAYLADANAYIGFPSESVGITLAPGTVTAGSKTFGVRFSTSGTNPKVIWQSVALLVQEL